MRTQLDIDRNEKLVDAARAQVFSDVDSAYAMVNSTVILLQPTRTVICSRLESPRHDFVFLRTAAPLRCSIF